MHDNSTNQQARCTLYKFSSPTVPFSLLDEGATLNLHTHTPLHVDRLNLMPKCLWLNKIYILQIASNSRRNHDHYSTTFTCSSTYPLLAGGARIVQNNTVAKTHDILRDFTHWQLEHWVETLASYFPNSSWYQITSSSSTALCTLIVLTPVSPWFYISVTLCIPYTRWIHHWGMWNILF